MAVPPDDPLAGQRRASRALGLREQLLEGATRLCGQRGYSGSGVVEIAAAAGLNKNHVFHHFGSKEGLVLAALNSALATWRSDVAGASAIFPQPERQLAHVVQQLGVLLARRWMGLRLFAALAQERDALPPALQAATAAMLDELAGLFRKLFKDSRKSSGYGVEAKPKLMAALLLSTLLGAAAAEADPAELLELLRGLLFGNTSTPGGS